MSAPFDVFISYSRKDNHSGPHGQPGWVDAVEQFIAARQAELPGQLLRVFHDTADIRDYDDWRHRILESLRSSKVLLVVLSPNYFESENCRWEWEHFLRRQGPRDLGGDGVAVASVCVSDVPLSALGGKRDWYERIRRSNSIDLAPWTADGGAILLTDPDVQQHMQRLFNALRDRVIRARRSLAGHFGNLREASEFFVGRSDQLRDIHANLAAGKVGVVTALHGLGGIGKTELAVYYAHEYAYSYTGGVWLIEAAGAKDLRALIGRLAFLSSFPRKPNHAESRDETALYEFVLQVLRETADQRQVEDPDGGSGRILLILDNVDELELLGNAQRVYLPRADWLCVLATSRESTQSWEHGDRIVALPLDALAHEDAIALLRERQKNRAFRSADDAAAAAELVRDLDGYTLAVEQAATFLGVNPDITIRELLDQLRADGLSRLDEIALGNSNVRDQIVHAEQRLDLILRRTLPSNDTLERELLNYAALWAPDAIPKLWIEEWAVQAHPELCRSVGLSKPLPAAWQQLEHRRLLVAGAPELLRMHRLVAAHLGSGRDARLREAQRQQIAVESLTLERDAAHASVRPWRILALHKWTDMASPEDSRSAINTGNLVTRLLLDYQGPGRVVEFASRVYDRALQLAKAARDVVALRMLIYSLSNLGVIKARQGDAEGALRAYEASLRICEALAESEPKGANAQRNIALCLERIGDIKEQQGDTDGALLVHERSLEIADKLVRSDPHDSQLRRSSMINLSKVGRLASRTDPTRGLMLCERGLLIADALAQEEPHSVQAQRDLSVLLDDIGLIKLRNDWPGALQASERSLAISEALSNADPRNAQMKRDLSIGLNIVGSIRAEQGDLEGALQAFKQDLEISEELAQADPSSAQLLHDCTVSHFKLSELSAEIGEDTARMHHLHEIDRIFTSMQERDMHLSPSDRDLWLEIKSVLIRGATES